MLRYIVCFIVNSTRAGMAAMDIVLHTVVSKALRIRVAGKPPAPQAAHEHPKGPAVKQALPSIPGAAAAAGKAVAMSIKGGGGKKAAKWWSQML